MDPRSPSPWRNTGITTPIRSTGRHTYTGAVAVGRRRQRRQRVPLQWGEPTPFGLQFGEDEPVVGVDQCQVGPSRRCHGPRRVAPDLPSRVGDVKDEPPAPAGEGRDLPPPFGLGAPAAKAQSTSSS